MAVPEWTMTAYSLYMLSDYEKTGNIYTIVIQSWRYFQPLIHEINDFANFTALERSSGNISAMLIVSGKLTLVFSFLVKSLLLLNLFRWMHRIDGSETSFCPYETNNKNHNNNNNNKNHHHHHHQIVRPDQLASSFHIWHSKKLHCLPTSATQRTFLNSPPGKENSINLMSAEEFVC